MSSERDGIEIDKLNLLLNDASQRIDTLRADRDRLSNEMDEEARKYLKADCAIVKVCEVLGIKVPALDDIEALAKAVRAERDRVAAHLKHNEEVYVRLEAELRAELLAIRNAIEPAFDPAMTTAQHVGFIYDERERLRADLERVTKERDHWKANHDRMKEVKQAVLARPDLGERSEQVQRLTGERNDLAIHLKRSEDTTNRALATMMRWSTKVDELEAELSALKGRKVRLPPKRDDADPNDIDQMQWEYGYNAAIDDVVAKLKANGLETEL